MGIIMRSMSPTDVDAVANLPYSMLISDSFYGTSDCPHPCLYGSFPKLLTDWVYKRRLLTLEEAMRKMTRMSALRLGLNGRGTLCPSGAADLCVFNPEEPQSPTVYGAPILPRHEGCVYQRNARRGERTSPEDK